MILRLDSDLLTLFFQNTQAMMCRGVPKEERDRMRSKFHGKRFRAAALATFVNKKRFRSFSVHHIKPISLGGDNSCTNLALVEPNLHGLIHDFIDSQTKPLDGQTKELSLPVFPGRVWSFGIMGMKLDV